MARFLLFVCALGSLAAALPAAAHPRRQRDQDIAFQARREGRFMPLRAIEARIIPHMRGFDYLGPELEPGGDRYRLKFMRGPRVVWIDVDARTGQVLDRFGF